MEPIEYVFSEGTFAPYDVMYDTVHPVPATPVSAATSEVAAPTTYSNQRKLIRTSDGTMYVVYFKQLAGKYQIYVKQSADDGATWTDDTHISTYLGMGGYDQRHPSIAVDSNDYLHVVWEGMATGFTTQNQIWYALYDGIWQNPTHLSNRAGMPTRLQRMSHIAVDSNDYLHVVWAGYATGYTTDLQIWYTKYTDSWSTPFRISTLLGMDTAQQTNPSLAIDGDDNVHAVWLGTAGAVTTQIWYTKYITSWSSPIDISNHSPNGQVFPCIAVDSSDNLHVVWIGRTGAYPVNYQIWYNVYTNAWAGSFRISTHANMANAIQYYPSIAVDSSDDLHVLWYGKATGYVDDDKVWYNTYTVAWVGPVCLQPTGRNIYPNLRWSRWPS